MRLNVVVMLMLFLGLVASPGFAQTKVTGGVKGGVNLADISLDPEEPDCCDKKVGGAFGAFLNVGSERVSFQPEVLYSMKGAKGSDDSKIKVNFIEIPLLLRANLTPGPVHPFVVVGPGVSFRTKAEFEDPSGQKEDFEDEVEKTDFGMIFGGGIAFGPATVEARYDLGLRDLSKDADKARLGRFRSSLVSVSAGSAPRCGKRDPSRLPPSCSSRPDFHKKRRESLLAESTAIAVKRNENARRRFLDTLPCRFGLNQELRQHTQILGCGDRLDIESWHKAVPKPCGSGTGYLSHPACS